MFSGILIWELNQAHGAKGRVQMVMFIHAPNAHKGIITFVALHCEFMGGNVALAIHAFSLRGIPALRFKRDAIFVHQAAQGC
ncbi:MAG: hypothetical protein ACRD2O_00050 [Terriglobia bacterium]